MIDQPDNILKKLFDEGLAAQVNAYVPYSNHPVGAALVTENGKFFSGCNVEVAHYKSTCAETGAIAEMVKAGERVIKEIAVIGPGEHLCSPCGDCRQRIREFGSAATVIRVFDKHGTLMRSYTMEQLLPDGFGPDNVTAMEQPDSR